MSSCGDSFYKAVIKAFCRASYQFHYHPFTEVILSMIEAKKELESTSISLTTLWALAAPDYAKSIREIVVCQGK